MCRRRHAYRVPQAQDAEPKAVVLATVAPRFAFSRKVEQGFFPVVIADMMPTSFRIAVSDLRPASWGKFPQPELSLPPPGEYARLPLDVARGGE